MPLMPYEVQAFRGAVIQKVGIEDTLLFHHHLDDKAYHFSYPLIQYKALQGKPAIICLEEGVEDIHKFFEKRSWDLTIGEKTWPAKIHTLNLHQFQLTVEEQKLMSYQLNNWIALSQENYVKFQDLQNDLERIAFLENILAANILSFAKGIEWVIEQKVLVRITDLVKTKTVSLKQTKLIAFNINFQSNVFLPNAIGLGRKVSIGFGVVRAISAAKNKLFSSNQQAGSKWKHSKP